MKAEEKANTTVPATESKSVAAPPPAPPVEDVGDPIRRDKIVAALARARGEMHPVVKEKTAVVQRKDGGGRYEYAYATLDAAVAAAVPALSRHGLYVEQRFEELEAGTFLITTIWHESGQCMLPSVLRLDHDPADGPRVFGALVTYLRRYSYLAALGLAPEDDDGAVAQESVDARRVESESRPASPSSSVSARPAPMRPPAAGAQAPPANGSGAARGGGGPTEKQEAMLRGLGAELGVVVADEAKRAGIVVDGPRSASALIKRLIEMRDSAFPPANAESSAGTAGDVPF